VAEDLGYWSAEIPGKVIAKGEALTGPMTPPSKRVQTSNHPGSEVGSGTVATWGTALTDEVILAEVHYDGREAVNLVDMLGSIGQVHRES
jgi:hypothetical protein